ncbi:MAG: hypothetical protein SGJ10_05890 [Bacteroidota bacterium]|nr:hypothetical protein [Bacteroidota bacterium]
MTNLKNCILFLTLFTASNYIYSQKKPVVVAASTGLVYKDIPKSIRINFETMYPQKAGGGFKNKNYISCIWQKTNDTVYEVKITQANKSTIFSRYYKSGTWQLTGESLPVVLNKVSGLPQDLSEVWKAQYKTATIISAAKVVTPFNNSYYEIYYIQNNKKIRRFFSDSGFVPDKVE